MHHDRCRTRSCRQGGRPTERGTVRRPGEQYRAGVRREPPHSICRPRPSLLAPSGCEGRRLTTVRPVQHAFRGLRLIAMQPSWREIVEELLSGWASGPDEPRVRLRYAVPQLIVTHRSDLKCLPVVSFPSVTESSSGSVQWMTAHDRPAPHKGSRHPASIAGTRRLVARRRCSACAINRWRALRFHQWERRRPSSDRLPTTYLYIVEIAAAARHDANEARLGQQLVAHVVVSDLEITYRVTQFARPRRLYGRVPDLEGRAPNGRSTPFAAATQTCKQSCHLEEKNRQSSSSSSCRRQDRLSLRQDGGATRAQSQRSFAPLWLSSHSRWDGLNRTTASHHRRIRLRSTSRSAILARI
jgi:hypothetical protein